MQVSSVQLVETEGLSIYSDRKIPKTFFSLDAAEQMQYNAFRGKRDKLESRIIELRQEGKELKRNERENGEEEIHELFSELIQSHLKRSGLTAASCFAGYGEDKKTFVETPYYRLFNNADPFDVAIRVVYWFSTKDDTLSCTTNLDYQEGVSLGKSPKRQMVYDLLRKVVEEIKQDRPGIKHDGTNFPITDFRGDFIYFASSEYAMPLIGFIRDILETVDPEAIRDLNFLYSEYMKQKSYGEVSDTNIQQRVFREAYERKLETELVKAKFIGSKLTIVK